MSAHSKAFSRRMRQIVSGKREFFTQLQVETLERSGQFVLDALARSEFLQIRKLQDGIAERDPDWRPSQWQPIFL